MTRHTGLFNLSWLSLFLLLAALFSGCAALPKKSPEVALLNLQLENLSLSHAQFLAELDIFNPNDRVISIENIDYRLHLKGIHVGSGHSLGGVRIAAHDRSSLGLRLSSSYLNLLQLGKVLQKPGELPFVIEGTIHLVGFGNQQVSLPFRKTGNLPWAGADEALKLVN